MFYRPIYSLRLRPWRRQLSSLEPPVYRRLADKVHRSVYASMERETNNHRKHNAPIKLKPSIGHFVLWLRRKQEQKLGETTLRETGRPSSYKESAVIEVVLFHILTCLHAGENDTPWLASQQKQLAHLHSHLSSRQKAGGCPQTFTVHHARSLASRLHYSISEPQVSVLTKALQCMALACPRVASIETLVPWLESLAAPRITEACSALANLTYIPACVTSDILLRTPLSIDELALQLDLWYTFIEQIAQEYSEKRTHVTSLIENLVFYTVQFDPRKLEHLFSTTLSVLTSAKSGYTFKIVTHDFVNSLIYLVALTCIKNGAQNTASHMPIITAQKALAEHLGTSHLSQQGYVGVTLLISHESVEKAAKLLHITKTHFPENSALIHTANVYLSATPEELLHHFNVAILQYPNSATLWLVLAKKLSSLHLLTESRSRKLLSELLARKKDLVISKDIVLELLAPIESISGIEDFIATLEQSGLFVKFQNAVLNKYMALLYRYSDERSVHKPFLDKLVRHSSNVECARYLYNNIKWKTISSIGVMLNGEVNHRPADLYELYTQELHGHVPDEACLAALLRASTKRANNIPYTWGPFFAPQVAVHEFQKYVQSSSHQKEVSLYASNKLWQVYIHALRSAEYTAELAQIMRWWEEIRFVPSRSTLVLLLRALPVEFSERHIKHAHAVPSGSVPWPWPTMEEFRGTP